MLPGTYDEDDGLGIRHDVLVDSRIEVENAVHFLTEMNVMLDSIADDREGIWTDGERRRLRSMQGTVQGLIERKEADLEEISEEYERVREEML